MPNGTARNIIASSYKLKARSGFAALSRELVAKVDIYSEFGRIQLEISRSGGIGRRATFRA
jgi:hypothetical protein